MRSSLKLVKHTKLAQRARVNYTALFYATLALVLLLSHNLSLSNAMEHRNFTG